MHRTQGPAVDRFPEARDWRIGAIGIAIAATVAAALAWPPIGRASSQQSGTPVVDPEPTATPQPLPIYFPRALSDYDPLAPGPLPSQLNGYVVELEREWRPDCAPATHVLLDRPQGESGAAAKALMYVAPEAHLNLDLYIGEYVSASGLLGLAPEPCRQLTWSMLEVREITILEVPPGALATD